MLCKNPWTLKAKTLALCAGLGMFSAVSCAKEDEKVTPPDLPEEQPNEPPTNPSLTQPTPNPETELTIASIVASAPEEPASGALTLAEDRVISNTVARANLRDKPVLVKATGAWCGPCQQFVIDKENGDESLSAEEFAVTYDAFDHVEIEEMHLSIGGYWRFLPQQVQGVPTFFAYEPSQNHWNLVSIGYGDLKRFSGELQKVLDARANGEKAPDMPLDLGSGDENGSLDQLRENWEQFLQKAQSGQEISRGEIFEHISFLTQLTRKVGVAEAVAEMARWESIATENSETIKDAGLVTLSFNILLQAQETHDIAFEDVQTKHPVLYRVLVEQRLYFSFTQPLSAVSFEKGAFSAASICRNLRDYALERFFEEGQERNKAGFESEGSCLSFESAVGLANKEQTRSFLQGAVLEAKGDEEPDNLIDPQTAARMAQAVGEVEYAKKAAAVSHTNLRNYFSDEITNANERVSALQAELSQTEDGEKRAELEKKIAAQKLSIRVAEMKIAASLEAQEIRNLSLDGGLKSPFELHPLFVLPAVD